jgi:HEAT repeat protein
MIIASGAQDDPRSIEELVSVSLSEAGEEVAIDALRVLQWKGNYEVLRRAESLCASECSRERILGANVLGQLGLPERTFPIECCKLLREILDNETDAYVLQAALVGLSHQKDVDAIPRVTNFLKHASPDVRQAAAFALMGHETSLAIESLIILTRDSEALVRDWATFALATQIDLDTDQIRGALVNRLNDPDDDTRGEALVGLARRKDERVIAALKTELSSDCVGSLAIEAAELIASTELHPYLVALREWWDVDSGLLEQAIAASTGPGPKSINRPAPL